MRLSTGKRLFLYSVVVCLTAGAASAQVTGPPVMKSVDEIVDEGLGTGTADPKRDSKQEVKEVLGLKTVDLGAYMQTDQAGNKQDVPILVAEGERVFCSVPTCAFNPENEHYVKPLADDVEYKWVGLKESVNYYDDGTHGDVVANDGLPSNIVNKMGQAICPYCYRHMRYLENLRERAKWRNFWEFSQQPNLTPLKEEPTTFFAGVYAASMDTEILDPKDTKDPMRNYYVFDEKRKKMIADFEDTVLALYKKRIMNESIEKDEFMDYWLYPDLSRRLPPTIPAPMVGTSTGRVAGAPKLPSGGYPPGGRVGYAPYGGGYPPGGGGGYPPYGGGYPPGGGGGYPPYGGGGGYPPGGGGSPVPGGRR